MNKIWYIQSKVDTRFVNSYVVVLISSKHVIHFFFAVVIIQSQMKLILSEQVWQVL